jgi:hypothetical protein
VEDLVHCRNEEIETISLEMTFIEKRRLVDAIDRLKRADTSE